MRLSAQSLKLNDVGVARAYAELEATVQMFASVVCSDMPPH